MVGVFGLTRRRSFVRDSSFRELAGQIDALVAAGRPQRTVCRGADRKF